MKKTVIILLAIALLLIPISVFAATTSSQTGNVWNVITLDEDHTMSRMRIKLIIFVPGAAGDECILTEATDAGNIFFPGKSADGEPRLLPMYGAEVTPFFDFSESTITAGAYIIIILEN